MSIGALIVANGRRQDFQPSITTPVTPAPLCIGSNGKLFCNHALDASLKNALVRTGTGAPCLRRLPVGVSLDISPYWNTIWTANTWQTVQNAFAAVRYTAPTGAVAFSTFGSLTASSNPYRGMVYLPNINQILCIPWNATQAALITMSGPTVTLVSGSAGALFTGAGAWMGGHFAYDANVYCMPSTSSNVMKITPTGYNTLTTAIYAAGGNSWSPGCFSSYNGAIYAPPAGSSVTKTLKVVPNGSGAPTISQFGSSSFYYSAGVSAHNGKLYFLPSQTATDVLVIDPTASDTQSKIGTLTTPIGWSGAIQAPNGNIYGVPDAATSILKINPWTNAVSQFGSLLAQHYYRGGVLAPDGKIYCTPTSSDNNQMLVIDTNTDTVSYIAHTASNYGFGGGCLGVDGYIYMAPATNQTNFTRLFSGFGDIPVHLAASPYLAGNCN